MFLYINIGQVSGIVVETVCYGTTGKDGTKIGKQEKSWTKKIEEH
jgi:hypothetical protein